MSDSAVTPATRRKLRFNRIDDALIEVDRLIAAEREGRLTRAGQWTLGQTLGHLATWADFAFDGYPASVRPPLPLRWIFKLLRKRVLARGMPVGVKIGKIPGGTVGLEVLPTDQAFIRFRAAMARLGAKRPTIKNPLFGQLSHDEWVALNLRHAELHLGFQIPLE